MGNYRFKFSDMIPNAWIHKLKFTSKDMRNSGINKAPPPMTVGSSSLTQAPRRASYYFPSRQEPKLPSSPIRLGRPDAAFPTLLKRKSEKKISSKLRNLSTADVLGDPPAKRTNARRRDTSLGLTASGVDVDEDDDDYYEGVPCAVKPIIAERKESDRPASRALSRSSSCRFTSSATDIILDMGSKRDPGLKTQKTGVFNGIPELVLPPIVTKGQRPENANGIRQLGSPPSSRQRRISVRIQRLKTRTSSPRLHGKKIRHRKSVGQSAKKFLSESFAVVKSSADPGRDFRDSMVEMIIENNILESKDLEDLLACYLSLNSGEYHDVIIKVFEQIWFELTQLRLLE
ncbi:ovate family protein 3 [Wolffia australiana]